MGPSFPQGDKGAGKVTRELTESDMEKRVSLEIENGIAEVRLSRGDKMNALDTPMFSALIDTGERL